MKQVCLPDEQTVADLLTLNGVLDFNITDETWSVKKGLLAAGMSEERADWLIKRNS